MNSKIKILITLLALVVVIGGSTMLYKNLSGNAPSSNILVETSEPTNVTQESTGESSSTSTAKKSITNMARDITFYDADGNAHTLSDFRGKPVVLNFWASWCPPCKAEMPEFQKVFEEIGDDVNFIMLDTVDGVQETQEAGEKHIEEQSYTFPVYFDTAQEGAVTYNIRSIPTTIFIDAEGYLVTGAQGAIDEALLRKGISMADGTYVEEDTDQTAEYKKITPEDAKQIMDKAAQDKEDYYLLDARTQPEFDEGHIAGAVVIPETEVAAKAAETFPDKDKLILVYCRSGRRSEIAANELLKLGYTNVYDFGGIIDWPYDVEK